MGLFGLALRYVRGSLLRGGMTIAAVAVCLVGYLLLRTVGRAWTEQVAQTPNNRVVTRHKLGWAKDLPARYAETIRGMPGVETAVGIRWTGLKHPRTTGKVLDSFAVESAQFVEMHYELEAPPEQKRAFVADRQGALVSEELAREFGWKVGDAVRFESVFGASFDLNVSCVFKSTRYGFARKVIWFHGEYFNEAVTGDARERISLVSARIADPRQGARIARAIDAHFDDADDRTFSQEDKALTASSTGRFAAILEALELVSVLVLGVVALILGNTMAMSVRERENQYGTLRAIGFRPQHIAGIVLAEAGVIGLAGGALSLAVSYPLLERGVSRYFEQLLDLPPLELSLANAAGAVVFSLLLGLIATSLPAYRLSRRGVVEAMRHID